jgi:hypothetical protein
VTRFTPELRRCRLCKLPQEFVYRDGVYRLVKYGIRHYAHPLCLAKEHGSIVALEMIPEHQRPSLIAALRNPNVCDWEKARIGVIDDATKRARSRP